MGIKTEKGKCCRSTYIMANGGKKCQPVRKEESPKHVQKKRGKRVTEHGARSQRESEKAAITRVHLLCEAA